MNCSVFLFRTEADCLMIISVGLHVAGPDALPVGRGAQSNICQDQHNGGGILGDGHKQVRVHQVCVCLCFDLTQHSYLATLICSKCEMSACIVAYIVHY